MTNELDAAVTVDFPLRGGGWVAVNTPGDRIPSHGTDMLGQRFAYDLLKVDARGPGLRYSPAGLFRGFFVGVRTRDSRVATGCGGVHAQAWATECALFAHAVRGGWAVSALSAAWRMHELETSRTSEPWAAPQ